MGWLRPVRSQFSLTIDPNQAISVLTCNHILYDVATPKFSSCYLTTEHWVRASLVTCQSEYHGTGHAPRGVGAEHTSTLGMTFAEEEGKMHFVHTHHHARVPCISDTCEDLRGCINLKRDRYQSSLSWRSSLCCMTASLPSLFRFTTTTTCQNSAMCCSVFPSQAPLPLLQHQNCLPANHRRSLHFTAIAEHRLLAV